MGLRAIELGSHSMDSPTDSIEEAFAAEEATRIADNEGQRIAQNKSIAYRAARPGCS